MAAGALFVLLAAGIVFYNREQDRLAAAASGAVVRAVERQFPERRESGAAQEPLATLEIDGHSYIGVLEIPALGRTLPVMADWDYPSLRIAPCRYEGSLADGDLIIAAHNYESHFGRLATLREGDRVLFTDVSGNVTRYAVSSLESLDGYDVDGMRAGEWDLTLYTCTVGGARRVTARCVAEEGEERDFQDSAEG